MLSLTGIQKYIASLGIVEYEKVYIGKMDNKKECTIGVYNRKKEGPPEIAIGGPTCTTYKTKPASLLIHWNKSIIETERAAFNLFRKLQESKNITIDGKPIYHVYLAVSEPQDVGTDENGIYEYVIWLDFIYERSE